LACAIFDCVVICIGDDIRASVLTTVLCREMGAKKIVAKRRTTCTKSFLSRTGADPRRPAGARRRHSLARSLVAEGVRVTRSDLSESTAFNEIEVPHNWIGRSLAQIDVRNRYGFSIFAHPAGRACGGDIDPNEPFHADDSIYILGDNKSLERIKQL
jgi:trk system potassium uptake protein TrkA